ncbi:MAG: hypothetical protein OXH28_03825 [bacterium]|nr:hypothetical protein [bacterium]
MTGFLRGSGSRESVRRTLQVLVGAALGMLLTFGVAGGVAAQDDDVNRGIGGYYEPRGPVTVVLEEDPVGYDALSPNFVPLIARLLDPGTNEPVGLDYVVLAGLTDAAGRRGTTIYGFSYPYLNYPETAPVGEYKGTVIVPAPGQWTVVVNVFDPIDEAESEVPTSLGHAELTINVTDAATLLSAAEFGEVRELPSANPGEVILLTVHSIFGVLWFAVALALACISSPNRAKWFSVRTNDFLERNVNRLVRGAIAVTFVMWLTGILNLNILVAYPPPLSASQARALFTLPYAQPYTISLYLKIAMYSVMTLLLIPLSRAARRSAGGAARRDRWAGMRRSRWAAAEPKQPQRPAGRPRLLTVPRVSLATIGLGGIVIVVCVTILKYTHILSESIGSLTP